MILPPRPHHLACMEQFHLDSGMHLLVGLQLVAAHSKIWVTTQDFPCFRTACNGSLPDGSSTQLLVVLQLIVTQSKLCGDQPKYHSNKSPFSPLPPSPSLLAYLSSSKHASDTLLRTVAVVVQGASGAV